MASWMVQLASLEQPTVLVNVGPLGDDAAAALAAALGPEATLHLLVYPREAVTADLPPSAAAADVLALLADRQRAATAPVG